MSGVHADQKFPPANWWTKYDADPDFISVWENNDLFHDLSLTEPTQVKQIMIGIWDQLTPEGRAELAQTARERKKS
jgi:hypothetical protein